MNRSIVLISVGLLNFLHGMFHIIQFIQSMLLVAHSMEHGAVEDQGILHAILHHPLFALLWAVVGILTLIIGIKDYLHHRKCETEHPHTH